MTEHPDYNRPVKEVSLVRVFLVKKSWCESSQMRSVLKRSTFKGESFCHIGFDDICPTCGQSHEVGNHLRLTVSFFYHPSSSSLNVGYVHLHWACFCGWNLSSYEGRTASLSWHPEFCAYVHPSDALDESYRS